jgi:hypothetical protein
METRESHGENNASTRKRRPLGNAHFIKRNPHREEYAQAQNKTHWEKEQRPRNNNTYIFTLYPLTISCIRAFDYSLKIYT